MAEIPPVDDFASILTPERLRASLKARMPWPRDQAFDFSGVASFYWRRTPDTSEEFCEACYPALKHLSTLGVSNIPDLTHYLPPVVSTEFPQQALGLLILLDQGPRLLLSGTDARYVTDYFDILALKLARQLTNLSEELQPHRQHRWTESGYTFNHWAVAQFWFMAPLAHSEELPDHKVMTSLGEVLRAEVETHTGKMDPYRDTREEESKDPTAFSKRASAGPPYHEKVTMDEFVFWFLMIFDTHPAIVETFGRYPYRNSSVGRESTDREKEYLEETNHFAEASPDVAKKILADVQAGKWTPLGG